MKSDEVITLIRKNRPGSIQTQKQKEFVYEFERSYLEALCIFPEYRNVLPKGDSQDTLLSNNFLSKSAELLPSLNIQNGNQENEKNNNGRENSYKAISGMLQGLRKVRNNKILAGVIEDENPPKSSAYERTDNVDDINLNIPIFTPESIIERKKKIKADVGRKSMCKSIVQSLRDQMNTLPIIGRLIWFFIIELFCYIVYSLYVESITYAFGWSAFLSI
jgi:hypothetical protein